jgi:hypothetical protein
MPFANSGKSEITLAPTGKPVINYAKSRRLTMRMPTLSSFVSILAQAPAVSAAFGPASL